MADEQIAVTRAKVAAVTSDAQLAINAGSNKGIEVGDKVYLHRRVDVRDPDTSEVLGTVQYIRLQFVVSYVQERMAVATIVDKEDVDDLNPARIRRLKKVTTDLLADEKRSALVTIGESALVRRDVKKEAADDEPPF